MPRAEAGHHRTPGWPLPGQDPGAERTQTVTTTEASGTGMPAGETADRLAIRELFDAYAHCADRRDAKGQMALFTPDTRFVVYMDSRSEQPTQELHQEHPASGGHPLPDR